MNVKITPTSLSGIITAPPSKSYAHRLIISAFLSGNEVTIKNAGYSKDVLATVNALNALGGNVSVNDDSVIIKKRTEINGEVVVDCNESGSTLRFLMPIACALGISAKFIGSERLMQRPIGELANTLEQGGATVIGHTVSGKLKAGRYEVDASVSSQYITGLLFALAVLDGDSELVLKGNVVSRGYIDITLDVLSKFGISVKKTNSGYLVLGGQKFKNLQQIEVEGDYSGSAFMLALGAIGSPVSVKGLNPNSKQGDAKIIEVLKLFGASVQYNDGLFMVKNQTLHAIELDCEDIPDLVQIISVVASYANGVTVLKNVDRLRVKESDRIEAVISTLKNAGISAYYNKSNLYITGGNVLGGVFDGGNDHRTVMSATILSSYAKGSSTINGAEAYTKSYPEFYNDYKLLGGIVDVEI